MAAFASLGLEGGRRLLLSSVKNSAFAGRLFNPQVVSGQLSKPVNSCYAVVVRSMSDKRTIWFRPSRFEWTKFKDHANFYVMLGLLPIAGVITFANLFYGPYELADIPEGYEPKPWEYYKSPITRFIARYLVDSPEKWYERHMHFVAIEKDKIQLKKLQQKIELLINEADHRYDSKYWYYLPYNDRIPKSGRVYDDLSKSSEGSREP